MKNQNKIEKKNSFVRPRFVDTFVEEFKFINERVFYLMSGLQYAGDVEIETLVSITYR